MTPPVDGGGGNARGVEPRSRWRSGHGVAAVAVHPGLAGDADLHQPRAQPGVLVHYMLCLRDWQASVLSIDMSRE